MLRAIDENLWVAEQPFRYFGLGIGTRMTVVRLASDELGIISPIQVSEALVGELNALGKVSHIIAPNLYHYKFAAEFKATYPGATFWATAGLGAKRPELPIDRAICHRQGFANAPALSPWPGLECLFFDGFKTLAPSGPDPLEEWVFFHSASRTLILTDTAFCFDESSPWLTQLVTKIGGGYKQLGPSLLERVATTEKAKVRDSAEQVLAWDFERVIVAHGRVVDRNGKAEFKRGYGKFLGCSL
ncbi:DUF4336 domain-containing protein [Nodosilinea sp. PGN35]|uniref:DUF4336 domain-containing protein n=1 Tax=Nodosilinea sp. PGN35 TaxID=3020489 RepID=UPI0023B34516|nr:DUF4336 domain-containing protein [Nodosilinea sp. TSF1-S3]MDF0366006.1 DUF4336 domain-containing protein [Nodosilinea sp. TSF1-S3]